MEIPGTTGAFFNCPPPDFSVLSEVVNSTSSASSFFEDDFGNSCSFFLNSAGLPNPNTPVSDSFNFEISYSETF